MPVPQLIHRKIVFNAAAFPSFPAEVTLNVTLSPAEAFGEAPLSGRLRLVSPGQEVTLLPGVEQGGIRRPSQGQLERRLVEALLFEARLRIDGREATIEAGACTRDEFEHAVRVAVNFLPSLISTALGAPVEAEHLSGKVGEVPFVAQVVGSFEQIVSVVPDHHIASHLEALAKLPAVGAERFFQAARYLNQARWLEYGAQYPTQFVAERLLNLAKALEVLFACREPRPVEVLRQALSHLEVRPRLIELLASVLYVRNQVDVGHVRLDALELEELNTFHRLTLHAGLILEWLLMHIVDRSIKGLYILPSYTPSGQASRPLGEAQKLLDALDRDDLQTYLGPPPHSREASGQT